MDIKTTLPTAQMPTTTTDTHAADAASLLPAAAPAGKLDADNYNAEDLEGVTESLFGSGNLNYLMLQGRQTDQMLAANSLDSLMTHELGLVGSGDAMMTPHSVADISAIAGPALTAVNLAENWDQGRARGLLESSNNSASTVFDDNSRLTSISDSIFSRATPGLPGEGGIGLDGLSGIGLDGRSGIGRDGIDGGDGGDGKDGKDGKSPEPPGPPDPPDPPGDPDIDLSAHNDLGLPLIDLNLDPIEHVVGDIDIGIGQTLTPNGIGLDLHAIVAGIPIIDTTLNPVIPGVTDHVFPIVDRVADLADPDNILRDPVGAAGATADDLIAMTGLNAPSVEQLLQPLETALQPVTDFLSPVVDTLQGLVSSEGLQGPVTEIGQAVEGVANTLGLDVPSLLEPLAPVTDLIAPTLNGTVEAVNDGLSQLTSALSPVLGDAAGGLGLDSVLENPLGLVGDTLNPVLENAGIDLQDVSAALAPVADTVGTVLDVGGLLQNPQEALSGAIGGIDDLTQGLLSGLPGGIGGTPAPGADTDLSLTTDMGLSPLSVTLDPVESIAGDIDISLPLTHGDSALGLGVDVLALGSQIIDQPVSVPLPYFGDPVPNAEPDLGVHNDLGLPQLDVNLDAVESVTGDIDLTLPITHDTDSIDVGVGGVLPGSVLPDLDISIPVPYIGAPTHGGDEDIFAHNDLGLPQLDVNLDTIESVTGDIDLGGTITHAADSLTVGGLAILANTPLVNETQTVPVEGLGQLTGMADSILHEASSITSAAEGAIGALPVVSDIVGGIASTVTDSGAASWPQMPATGTTPDVADTLGSLIGGIADAATHLPAPTGSVAEGLGLLNIGSDHGGGALSGLHSGHHGGLFG